MEVSGLSTNQSFGQSLTSQQRKTVLNCQKINIFEVSDLSNTELVICEPAG